MSTTTTLLISTSVLLNGPDETGYCYIAFSSDFEDFVAKEMPRGLAPFDAAFIRVSHLGDVWQVDAVYINDGTSRTLWRTAERPAWIGKVRKEKPDGISSEESTTRAGC
jgi:hypothetical protein